MLKYYKVKKITNGICIVLYSKYILGTAVSAAMEKLQLKIAKEGVRGPIFN